MVDLLPLHGWKVNAGLLAHLMPFEAVNEYPQH